MTKTDAGNTEPHKIAEGILKHIVTPAIKAVDEDDINIPALTFETAFKSEDSGTLMLETALRKSKVDMAYWVAVLKKIASKEKLTHEETMRFQKGILTDFAHYTNALFELRRNLEVRADPFGHTRNQKEADLAKHEKETMASHLAHAKDSDELFRTMDTHFAVFGVNRELAGDIANVITNFDAIEREVRNLAKAMKLELIEPERSK